MAFRGFSARNAATQSLSADTMTRLTLGTTDFDTESAFGSDVYTIPSDLHGEFMQFFAGVAWNSNERGVIVIRRDTGSGFREIARGSISGSNGFGGSVCSPPVQVNAGDVFDVGVFAGTSTTVNDNDRVFFSGCVLPDFEGFLARRTTTQSFPSSDNVTFPTIEYDTDGYLFDPAPGQTFTVPAQWEGKYINLVAGFQCGSTQAMELSIRRSTDGGVTWLEVARNKSDMDFEGFPGTTCETGPILVSEGHQFDVVCNTGAAASTSHFNDATFFGAYTVAPPPIPDPFLGSVVFGLTAPVTLTATVETTINWTDVVSSEKLSVSPGKYVTAPAGARYAIAYYQGGEGSSGRNFIQAILTVNEDTSNQLDVARNADHSNEFNTIWVGHVVPVTEGDTLSVRVIADTNSVDGLQPADTRFGVAFYA